MSDGQSTNQAPSSTSSFSTLNEWFLSLPEGRQDILKEDKWMLAEAAFQAGREAAEAGDARERKCLIIDYRYDADPVETVLFDYDTQMGLAEQFCRDVKAKGGVVNIKTRVVGAR